jgi:diadenylate cyclase
VSLPQALHEAFNRFEPASILDILAIAAIIYAVLVLAKGTVAMALLRGAIILVVVVIILAQVLELRVLQWVLRNSFPALLIAIPVIFQPEIRRFLERLGRTGLWPWSARPPLAETVEAVTETALALSQRRHGAIIVLERGTGLEEYADTGIRLDALVSRQLLEGIFTPTTPLHDGAVIIRGDRILACGCTLPLSARTEGHGLRHRAALGLSEVTDAVCVVVSEETGEVSVAANGRMLTVTDASHLRAVLRSFLLSSPPQIKAVPS